jgi:gliding motility-associated-like protein
VEAGPDQRVLAGTEVFLTPDGTLIHDQKWLTNNQLTCDTCFHTSANMERTTTFYIDVTSDHGCRASDSVRVLVYCDNSQIFIPNSFTPNGDGENDVFYPRGKGVKAINSFRIYNRWGQLVYDRNGMSLNDPSMGWNGTYNGDKAHPDVYVYFMDAVCYTGEPIFIKGDVTILK